MRTFFFVIFFAAAITAALLWNRHQYAPTNDQNQELSPTLLDALPRSDKVTIYIGNPPGKLAEKPRPKVAEKPYPAPKKTQPTPLPPPRPKPVSPTPRPTPEPVTRKAKLRPGESVYRLAGRLLGDPSRYKEIMQLNGLTEETARQLPSGSTLIIPPR